MTIELNEKEIDILKSLIDHHLGWATYKTEHITMLDEEKNKMLKDIEFLTLLTKKFEQAVFKK